MIELIVIMIVFSKPGEILREKGWERTLGWEFLGVAVYLGSLVFGMALYGAVVVFFTGEQVMNSSIAAYAFACAIAFLCVCFYLKVLRAFPLKVVEKSEDKQG